MTHDEHTPHRGNIPAYAIGALDDRDVAALETHLRSCLSCQNELAEYRAMSASLLMAVPPKHPPAALRTRLAGKLPSARKITRPRFTFSLNRFALGLTVIALFVLNLVSLMQLRQIQSQQARLSSQFENAQAALVMLSSPNIIMLPVLGENVSGTLLLDRERNQAVLVTQNLPPLSENQIYQIWLVKPDGGRDSAGLFSPESGQSYTTQNISTSQPFSDYLGIGVTVEPAGGSDAPTGERVFKVDF
ncbi:MAG TPA: anti-sigma factor [Anaerolineales bacterium]